MQINWINCSWINIAPRRSITASTTTTSFGIFHLKESIRSGNCVGSVPRECVQSCWLDIGSPSKLPLFYIARFERIQGYRDCTFLSKINFVILDVYFYRNSFVQRIQRSTEAFLHNLMKRLSLLSNKLQLHLILCELSFANFEKFTLDEIGPFDVEPVHRTSTRRKVVRKVSFFLRTNVKSSLRNIAVFISTEQNESYVIRRNNIKRKTLSVYYSLIKRKKLFGQPNTTIRIVTTIRESLWIPYLNIYRVDR